MNNPVKKWIEELNGHFSKEDIQMANKQVKEMLNIINFDFWFHWVFLFRKSVLLCCNLLLQHWNPTGIIVVDRGGWVFWNTPSKFQSFHEPLCLVCDLHKHLFWYSSPTPLRWERETGEDRSERNILPTTNIAQALVKYFFLESRPLF